VLEELGAFGKESGSGIRSAAIAIYLASRYVAKPSAGLLAAAFAKQADTDTIACMAGAILGAFSGDVGVDGLARDLLDSSYISDLAVAVASHEEVPLRAEVWDSRTSQAIRRRLAGLERESSIALPLFGESLVVDVERPETKSRSEIGIWWLKTELGQTLAVTKVTREKDKPSPKGRPTDATSHPDQLAIGDMARADASTAQSTWTFVFVRDLARALGLYHEILGLPIRRRSADMAVLGGSLVLEQSELREERRPAAESFEALEIIGVLATPTGLETLHRRAAKAGYAASDITRGRHGDRFRLRDEDGHVVEVWASPPGEADRRST
jgi:catechol 2,3-dioxygenase-like lactoylglutathione lyase family enzyme